MLSVGFAKENITPDYPVHLSGYGDDETRLSQGVKDPIYLTCIAITDGEDTLLLYTADLLSMSDWAVEKVRALVTPATGVPGSHIFCGATHSHSSPLLYGDHEPTVRFREAFLSAAVKVARDALADRAPAQMHATTQEVRGMNFIRHYQMEDGSYTGSNFGRWDLKILRHATETDPRMILVSFTREEKPDVVMMNWQAHNDNVREVGHYLLSSSYAGRLRDAFQRQTGKHFAFFMGASGNQNAIGRIPGENHNMDYIGYAETLAGIAIRAQKLMKPVTGQGIKVRREILTVAVDHAWDPMLPQAEEVYRLWKTVGKKQGDALGKTYGFTSSFQAGTILARAKMPQTTQLELNVFSIGDMGFCTSVNEVFSTVGRFVRGHAPYDTTFFVTGNCRYLPCAEAYDYRSYEADTALYAKGTAEKVAEKLTEMLWNLKKCQ